MEENHPLHLTVKETRGGDGLASKSFLTISDPFVGVCAMKKADNGNAVILRLVEMEGVDKEITVQLPFEAVKVEKCNLVEEGNEPLPCTGTTLKLRIGHHAIETFRITVAER